jgi:hypothetical protein
MSKPPTPAKHDATVFDIIDSYQAFDWDKLKFVEGIGEARQTNNAKSKCKTAATGSADQRQEQEVQEHYVCTPAMHKYINDVVFTSHISRLKTPMWLSTARKMLFKDFKAKFANALFAHVRKVTGSRYSVNKYLRHGHIILRKIDEHDESPNATVAQLVTAAKKTILKAPLEEIAGIAQHLEFYGIYIVILDIARLFVCQGAIVICDTNACIALYHQLPPCDHVLPHVHLEHMIEEEQLQAAERSNEL